MVPYRVSTQYLAPLCVFQAVENVIDVQILQSRDALRWKRAMKRWPFLSRRREGNRDTPMVTTVNAPIEVDDQLWFF